MALWRGGHVKLDDLLLELSQTELIDRRKGTELLPKHVMLVVDEDTGMAQYMTLLPDGHLGAVEEF
jgi:hypothetical protein